MSLATVAARRRRADNAMSKAVAKATTVVPQARAASANEDTAPLPRGIRIRTHKAPDGSITKKTIQISFSFQGRECRETAPENEEATEKNIARAEAFRKLILFEIERGEFDYAKRFPKSRRAGGIGITHRNPSVGALLDDWLSKLRGLEPSTLDGYRKIVSQLKEAFGTVPVRSLSTEMVEAFIAKHKAGGKTIRNVLSVLRSSLDKAKRDKKVTANVVRELGNLRSMLPRKRRNPFEENDVDPFTRAERAAILKAAKEEPVVHNFIQTGFGTGLRIGELIGMAPQDLDFRRSEICVRQSAWRDVLKGPKTDAGFRKVPMSPDVKKALKDQVKRLPPGAEFVFYDPRYEARWASDAVFRKVYWKLILAKAKIRYRYPYQMRHSWASQQVADGKSIIAVSHMLGHATAEVAVRHYLRYIPSLHSR